MDTILTNAADWQTKSTSRLNMGENWWVAHQGFNSTSDVFTTLILYIITLHNQFHLTVACMYQYKENIGKRHRKQQTQFSALMRSKKISLPMLTLPLSQSQVWWVTCNCGVQTDSDTTSTQVPMQSAQTKHMNMPETYIYVPTLTIVIPT